MRRGSIGAKLFLRLPISLPDQQTDLDRLFMHIQSCASWIEYLHFPLARDLPAWVSLNKDSLLRAPEQRETFCSWQQGVVPALTRISLLSWLFCTRKKPISGPEHLLLFYPFSSWVV